LIPNLEDEHDNLPFWDSWNDRITSFQTFNRGSSRHTCFWFDSKYSDWSYGVAVNKSVLNVGTYYNDKFSSIRTPDTSGC